MKGAMRSYSFLVEVEAIQPDSVAVLSGSDESATPGLSANRKLDALTSILKPAGCVSVKVLPDMLFLSYCRSVEQGFRRLTVASVFLS
jgi:hypothetical protein